jgi:hypothetical protein
MAKLKRNSRVRCSAWLDDMKTLTTTLPEIKLKSRVPSQVLAALARREGRYTNMVSVFLCIQLDVNHWVGVAGDGNNGSYEHFSMRDGNLTCSDVGYGDTIIALRDILVSEVV